MTIIELPADTTTDDALFELIADSAVDIRMGVGHCSCACPDEGDIEVLLTL